MPSKIRKRFQCHLHEHTIHFKTLKDIPLNASISKCWMSWCSSSIHWGYWMLCQQVFVSLPNLQPGRAHSRELDLSTHFLSLHLQIKFLSQVAIKDKSFKIQKHYSSIPFHLCIVSFEYVTKRMSIFTSHCIKLVSF